jgi:hypothetical protein
MRRLLPNLIIELAGGGSVDMPQQQIQMPVSNKPVKSEFDKFQKTHFDKRGKWKEEKKVEPKTDTFINIVSDIPPGWLAFIGLCFFVGLIIVTVILLKITKLGQLISKGLGGLKAALKALWDWKPGGGGPGVT